MTKAANAKTWDLPINDGRRYSDPSKVIPNPDLMGPYTVYSYTQGLTTNTNFAKPMIWYPNAFSGTMPPIVLIPGLNTNVYGTNADGSVWSDVGEVYPGASYAPGEHTDFQRPKWRQTVGGIEWVETDPLGWAVFLASNGFAVMWINPAALGGNAFPFTRHIQTSSG